jgi:hypothetical protein
MTSWLAHVDVIVNDSASTRGSALPVRFIREERLIDDSWLTACAESAEPSSSRLNCCAPARGGRYERAQMKPVVQP